MCEECWLSESQKLESIDKLVDTQKVLAELAKEKLKELEETLFSEKNNNV